MILHQKSDLLHESYTRYEHESGLAIYVFPKKMTSTYALLATDFGAVDHTLDGKELPDGVAHFLEHKLFTNEDGSDAFEHFSALGADANAYTSHTRTVYLFSCTEHFVEALGELIDFVTHPFFTEETVKKEQGIIAEEIRMCRDNPYDQCYYNMLRGLYRHHPVKKDICGSLSSIEKITPSLLYRVHEAYYQLSNMTLVVCGDVDPDAVFDIASKHISSTPKGAPPVRPTALEDRCVHHARISRHGQVAKPIFSIGVKDTTFPSNPVERLKRDAGMAILGEMLFSESGELYNSLFDEGLISPDLSFDYALTEDFAFLQIAGESGDPDAVFARIREYLAQKQQSGLSPVDFERCRRIEYAEYIKSFDSTEEIANTLLSFAMEGVDIFSYSEVLSGITLSFVEGLLREVFTPDSFTLSVIVAARESNT